MNDKKNWRADHGLPPRAPRDVTSTGLTIEGLRRLNDLAGTVVEVAEPGEMLIDVDGDPLAIGPSVTTRETLAAPVVGTEVFRALGADPADYPNITRAVTTPEEAPDMSTDIHDPTDPRDPAASNTDVTEEPDESNTDFDRGAAQPERRGGKVPAPGARGRNRAGQPA